MNFLPIEINYIITKLLNGKDLVSIRKVNKDFKKITDDTHIWRNIIEQELKLSHNNPNIKLYVKLREFIHNVNITKRIRVKKNIKLRDADLFNMLVENYPQKHENRIFFTEITSDHIFYYIQKNYLYITYNIVFDIPHPLYILYHTFKDYTISFKKHIYLLPLTYIFPSFGYIEDDQKRTYIGCRDNVVLQRSVYLIK
ncbi:F-box domain-containing protein [Orpheovirus IHUMI-LCC2]|uniref:F-box domain-containing protein n=1 Tax=Orpheovirus IHUMI-LCC2 TaxID=2023057 RepID=A0A2I2L3Y2_9VIRU|nr:F-box domain-containing protein [Orpheovirus IHUMI-LCC2]SNW62234.1 F-box domain-containing protein [Orpheovirus IHUMI-LCC2]